MKSKVNHKPDDERPITYPCLMVFETCVILIIDHQIGTVVGHTDNRPTLHKIGAFSDCWMMSRLRPFKGSVKLTG